MKSSLPKQLLLSIFILSAFASDDESPAPAPRSGPADLTSESLVVRNALRAVASAYDNRTTWSALYNPVLHVALGDYGCHSVLPAEQRIVDLALRGNADAVIEAIRAHIIATPGLAARLVASMHPVLRTWDAGTQNEVLFDTEACASHCWTRFSDFIAEAYGLSHIHQEINALPTTVADSPRVRWGEIQPAQGQNPQLLRRHRAIANAVTNYQTWSAMYVPFLLVATGQDNAEDRQLMQEVFGVQLPALLAQALQHLGNFNYRHAARFDQPYRAQAGLAALLDNNRYWAPDVQDAALPVAMRDALMDAYGQTGHYQQHSQQPANMIAEIVARFNAARQSPTAAGEAASPSRGIVRRMESQSDPEHTSQRRRTDYRTPPQSPTRRFPNASYRSPQPTRGAHARTPPDAPIHPSDPRYHQQRAQTNSVEAARLWEAAMAGMGAAGDTPAELTAYVRDTPAAPPGSPPQQQIRRNPYDHASPTTFAIVVDIAQILGGGAPVTPDRQFRVGYAQAPGVPRARRAPPSPAVLRTPEQNNHCAICLDAITSEAATRIQPCGHPYHTACIRDYLRARPGAPCPCCNGPVENRDRLV